MKDKLQALKDHLCELGYEDAVVFESPDYVDAYIGLSDDGRAVYSYDRMIECLMTDDNMTYEEAVEFIDFNTIRALPYFASKGGPIVLYDDPDYMWKDIDYTENKEEEKKEENGEERLDNAIV